MANRIVSVHEGICGIGIYAIMLPSSGFSVAHSQRHVTTKRHGHCDAWTKQSNNSCVTMRNPLSLCKFVYHAV